MHNHSHHHSVAEKGIKIAFFLNLGFAIVEIIGGTWINSYAIIADAVHDLGDSLMIGFAWGMQYLAKKESDNKFTFGYKRFSLLGALFNSLLLIVGSVLIIYYAIPRFFEPLSVHAEGMFVFALIGILINGFAVVQMKKGNDSLNERVVTLHLMEDVLGWVAVLLGSVLIYFFRWYWVDVALSLIIAVYVIYNASLNLKETILILLQENPIQFDVLKITEELKSKNKEILSVHDIHAWSLDGEHHVMSIHIVVSDSVLFSTLELLKKSVRGILKQKGIGHVTIEFETISETCQSRCD